MKILHIAPPFFPIIEAQGYGGIERVISDLIKEQNLHEIHIAAPKGTILKANVHETISPLGFFDRKERTDYTVLEHVRKTLEISNKIKPDVIHCHDDYLLPFMDILKAPSLLTLHSPYEDFWDFLKYDVYKDQKLVAISKRQKEIYEKNGFKIFDVVYHGVDINKYTFNEKRMNYLLSLSCIRQEKGQDKAIEIFDTLKYELALDLIIAGNIGDEAFFKEKIAPRIDVDISNADDKIKAYMERKRNAPSIIYTGEVNDKQKIPLFQNASIFLMPVTWEEPFGLVAVESMSCGTPVVAASIGALPEMITDKTGSLISNDYKSAILYSLNLSREDCRKHIENNFSTKKMASNYLELYSKIIR